MIMENKSSFRFMALLAGMCIFNLCRLTFAGSRTPLNAPVAPTALAPAPLSNSFSFSRMAIRLQFFSGDSITEQRLYTTLIETYVLTRYPAMQITFRNAGWTGDTAWLSKRGDFDAGMQRDVLVLKRKAVTIDFGMNDARGGEATFTKYHEYSTKLVKDLEKAGARVALLTPTPEERYEAGAPAGSTPATACSRNMRMG